MKKVIKIIGILVCIAVLFLNVSLNHKSSTGNIDLSKLILANQADAECVSTQLNNGRCGISGICFWNTDYTECDSTRG